MGKSRKEIIKDLIDFFEIEITEETMNYLEQHFDEYFDDEFFDELRRHSVWSIDDAIQYAANELEFIKEHSQDTVTLDKKKKTMSFNGHEVPAYWYEKDMPQEEIDEQLFEYRKMWLYAGLPKYKYPLLEGWQPLKEWEKEYPQEFLQRMEKDLENPNTEDGMTLQVLRGRGLDPHQVIYDYPNKLKKILKIENKDVDKDGFQSADVTVRIYDGSQCKIHIHASKDGSFRGISAIGRKGFPMFTDRDHRIIEREVFGRE